MSVSIYDKQNEDELLKCLVAQRRSYSKCKKISFVYILVSIILSLSSTIISFFISNDIVSLITLGINIAILIFSNAVQNKICQEQEKAAKLQQYFDVACYNHVAGCEEVKLSSIMTISNFESLIYGANNKEEYDSVRNWYSNFSDLSPYEQIYYSQQQNLVWDSDLRKHYKKIIFFVMISLILLPITFFIWGKISKRVGGMSLINMLLCIFVLVKPLYGIYSKLENDIKRLNELKIRMDVYEEDIGYLSKKSPKKSNYSKLKEIQEYIFENRKHCCLIPDIFYKLLKNKYQRKHDELAKAFVENNK